MKMPSHERLSVIFDNRHGLSPSVSVQFVNLDACDDALSGLMKKKLSWSRTPDLGEFYQIDMEMSFVEQDDVFETVEALMHELFTRGILPNGQLRPPRQEAPQLYKKSPLGWIAKEWSCPTISQILAKSAWPMRSGPFGSSWRTFARN
jgi:hypothetical protein